MDEWEEVLDEPTADVSRMQVPGGWLYRVRQWTIATNDDGYDFPIFAAMSVTFVPDAPAE